MRKAGHDDDEGRKETNITLAQMEKDVNAVYTQAWNEVNSKFEEFCEKFKKKDKIMRQKLEDGLITEEDYIEWYKRQTFQQKSWQSLADNLAVDLSNADKYASGIIKGTLPKIFAQAHNYGTYEVEKGTGINTFYKLYNADTVSRLIKDKPNLLPTLLPTSKTERDIREGKIKRWNHQKITSAVTQGVIQGESIPQISKRLQNVTDMNRKQAIRNARTATTGAEAAGRDASYARAEKKGIKVKRQWLAYLDNRTRDTHAILDGQIRAVGEPFEVYGEKIMYPGDPTASAALVYNCRCRTIASLVGYETDIREGRSSKLENMTYDEWKQAHVESYEAKLERKAERESKKYADFGGKEVHDVMSKYRDYQDFYNRSNIHDDYTVQDAFDDDIEQIKQAFDKIQAEREQLGITFKFENSSDLEFLDNVNSIWNTNSEKLDAHKKAVAWVKDIYGITDTQEANQILDNSVKRLVEASDVGVRVDANILSKVLDDGRFKNQFETGTSSGYLSSTARTKCEAEIFGVPQNLTEADRPIYGMLFPKITDNKNIDEKTMSFYKNGAGSGYGDTVVIFKKDKIKKSATLTIGDSLEDMSVIGATKMDNPVYTSSFSGKKAMESLVGSPKTKTSNAEFIRNVSNSYDYVEVQLHGIESHAIDNIEKVYLDKSNKNAVGLSKKLKKLGIPFSWLK